jgi:hypothetical protein
MTDCPTLHKFPECSTNRDFDIFEQLPDGTTVWRACVVGMEMSSESFEIWHASQTTNSWRFIAKLAQEVASLKVSSRRSIVR